MKFDTQVQALRTICSASRGGQELVTADDMGNLMNVLPVTAILNNSFFVSLGLIEKIGRGAYKPSELALKFQQKWSFNSAEAAKLLAPAFETSWFYEAVKTKLEIGPATTKDMIEMFAGRANTDSSYAAQYGFLLDWLQFVGLISTENGNVTLVGAAGVAPSAVVLPEATSTETEQAVPSDTAQATETVRVAPRHVPPIVSLSVEVVVTADDLAKLTPEQIATLFDGIGKVAAIQAALKH